MNFIVTLLPFLFSLTLAEEEIHPEFSAALRNVTASLYHQLAKREDGNFLFSPFSVTDIMALVQSGAYGATGEEIRTAFNLRSEKYQVEQAFSHIKRHLLFQEEYTVHSANKIYVTDKVNLKDAFKKTAEAVFYSEVESIDFGGNVSAADTINKWVEGKTENKIKDIIGDLDVDTKAVLVNALHFKATWDYMFYGVTDTQAFFFDDIIDMKFVETMHGPIFGRFHKNTELETRFLELYFEGKEVTFTVVLPRYRKGLSSIEDNLDEVFTPQNYRSNYTLIDVSLPKFKTETTLKLDEILREMGVVKMFSDDGDLSGIAGRKGDLVVNQVRQKSFIDVNEAGAEVPGATVERNMHSFRRLKIEPEERFDANHPFIYFVKFKDFIIFAGRIKDPTV